MSLSIDLIEISDNINDEILEDFTALDLETDLRLKPLLEYFKDYIKTSDTIVYDTDEAIKSMGYNLEDVSMQDYYVSEDGFKFWINGEEFSILIPLEKIPTIETTLYTIHHKNIRGLDGAFSEKYKSKIYANDARYIYLEKDFNMYKKHVLKDSEFRNVKWYKGLMIFNSY